MDRTGTLAGLVLLLVEATNKPSQSPVVAISGPGGFGKTALALQVCHDDRVVGAFAEIMWVETGEHCSSTRVVQLISDLCVHLTGVRPELSDAEQAGFHFASVLADRHVLLVIDNVWSSEDLSPFLLGGSNTVRLVTTRNARTFAAGTPQLRLGPMSVAEVTELLDRNIPGLGRHHTVELAHLCGGWPLLASVVSSNMRQDVTAGASPERAASTAIEALDALGAVAFDIWDSDQRKQTIGHAITNSLRSLDAHVEIVGTSDLQERYLSLAVFPAATPIPISALATWWHIAHGWTTNSVRQFCRVLADRSLIETYLADRDAILLHDVFRAHLRRLVGDRWAEFHRSLIDAFREAAGGDWAQLGSEHEYMWRRLSYHLREAGLTEELVDVLRTPEYVVKKAAEFGPDSLTEDRTELSGAERHDALGWSTAHSLTSGSYLLHGLTTDRDIAATLLASVSRTEIEPAVIEQLGRLVGEEGFQTCWATRETVDPLRHVGAVTTVAAWENSLVSGGEDGVVRLWDLTHRRAVRQHRGHTGWVYAVAISPDGRLIASAGDDSTIRLWLLETGELSGLLLGHTRRIRSLAFAANDRLVSGSEDGQVLLWDTETTRVLRKLEHDGVAVWAVAVSPESSLVAVAGQDESVRLIDLEEGGRLDQRTVHRDWVRSVSFAGQTLVSGSGDGSVGVWSVSNRRLTPICAVDTPSRVRSVAVSKNGDVIVAAGEDATLRAITDGQIVAEQPVIESVDWIRSVALLPDGAVAAGCEDGGVRLWRGDELTSLSLGSLTTWSAAFAGDHALLGRSDGNLELWDRAKSEPLRVFRAGDARVWSLAAGPHLAAASCADGTVRVWAIEDDWTLQLNEKEQRTWAVAVSQAEDLVAASSSRGTVRLWELPSGRMVWEHDAHQGRIRSMAFDDAGQHLLTGGGEGFARLWRLNDGTNVGEFGDPRTWVRTVAPDSMALRVALGCGPGDIHVYDVASGEEIAELHGHKGRVLMIGFAQDPDWLVSAAADGTVRLWSLSGSEELVGIRADASLQCAAFDRERGMILASSVSGTVAIRVPQIPGRE